MAKELLFYGKKIFFLGAHPDDIELGCGGLIAHIAAKAELFCITLSDNQKNPLLTNLTDEHYQSMQMLGVDREHVILHNFTTRRFQHERQEILEFLFELNRKFKPDIVFTHTHADLHQDHSTVTMEALRAFRGISVFGYDVIRSSNGFFPNFLVKIDEMDVEKKVTALAAYSTYKDKYYFSSEITKATLIRNGALAESHYAEGFDIFRMVGSFGELTKE
ncbi:MAG: hypothetical protein C4545_09420 [Anaerolineaceae bacterium]|jgi:LmbE family N-acetylglucosaminyl deacetylase|nr:MAG: hypothetical protein C4545_09420 [Anaerolineaceae bacterium]